MNYWPAALPEIQHFFAYSWFNLAPCSHLLYTWLFVIFSATLAININHLRINVFDVLYRFQPAPNVEMAEC